VLDVARLAGGNGSPAADTLSWDQEAELAANPGLLGCFYAGHRDQLAGKIQERYGVAKDEAERQLVEWERKASDSWFTKDTHRI
jgi:hypothetical protein